MLAKDIRDGMFHAVDRHAKTNKNTWKTMIPVQNNNTLYHWMSTIFYGWMTSQNLSAHVFKRKNDNFTFYEDFIKTPMKTVTNNTSLKLILIILRNYRRHTATFHSYQKELKLINVKNLSVICMTRKNMSYIQKL